jgi:hypothetical protein
MTQKRLSKNKEIQSSPIWFLLITVASVTLTFKTDFYDPFNSAKLILLLILVGWLVGHLINSYRYKPVRLRTMELLVY